MVQRQSASACFRFVIIALLFCFGLARPATAGPANPEIVRPIAPARSSNASVAPTDFPYSLKVNILPEEFDLSWDQQPGALYYVVWGALRGHSQVLSGKIDLSQTSYKLTQPDYYDNFIPGDTWDLWVEAVFVDDGQDQGFGTLDVYATVISGPATNFVMSTPGSAVLGAPFSFAVTAEDAANNPATTYTGTVHFTSTDGAATLPADTTLVDGMGTVNATLNTLGHQTITAADTVDSSIAGVSPDILVPGPATHFRVDSSTPVTAGSPFNVTVTALDASNDVATGYSGTVHFATNAPRATMPADSTLNGGVGNFAATMAKAGDSSANFKITARDTVSNTITGTSSAITVLPASFSSYVLSAASPQTSTVPFSVTVKATDQFGNVVSSYAGTVDFSSSDYRATLPSTSTFTNGMGTFQVTLRLGGTQTVTATNVAPPSIAGSVVIQVDGGAATHLVVVAPANVTAGTPFHVTVTALDAYNNVANGYSGTLHFWTNAPRATLPANSTLTNGAGTFNATLTDAGSTSANFKISAADTVSSIDGTSGAIAVAPTSTSGFAVSIPNVVQAGIPFHVIVTAMDAYSNHTLSAYSGTVHLTSSDGSAILPANSTLTNGVGTFMVALKTGGLQTVSAADTVSSGIRGTSSATTVLAAVILRVVAPSTVTAGTPFNFTVLALDRYFNVVPGYNGTIQFSTNAPRATVPGHVTLTNGSGTFSATFSKVAGASANFKISAADVAAPSVEGTSAAIAVTP